MAPAPNKQPFSFQSPTTLNKAIEKTPSEIPALRRLFFPYPLWTQRQSSEPVCILEPCFRAFVDALPTPLLLLKPDTGCVCFANLAAQHKAGQTLEQLVGQPYFKPNTCFNPAGQPLSDPQLPHVRAAQGQDIKAFEMIWRPWEDPCARSQHLRINAHLWPDRTPPDAVRPEAMLMITWEDITELARAQSSLKQTLCMQDGFLAMVGHELKTPLTALHLSLQALTRIARKAQLAEPPPLQMWPEHIIRKTQVATHMLERLVKLLEELMDISKMSRGAASGLSSEAIVLNRTPVQLGKLACDVVASLQESLQIEQLQVEFPEEVIGFWDEIRLTQVLINLLSNAAKYGLGKPVHLRIGRSASHAFLSITDHGIGIHLQDQARIFQRFARAVPHPSYTGLGMGLWVVHHIVKAHGGQVSVYSEPGLGSTFHIELPLDVPVDVPVDAPGPGGQADSPGKPHA